MALIKFSTPPTLAGLLFCLASAEGAGLFILPCYNVATRKRLQRLFCRPCNLYSQITKTVYRALQGLFLGFVPFYRRKYQTDTSGYNTACATLERLPAPGRLAPIQDTTVTPGRYTGQHSRPIIIRYIRVRPCSGSMPDAAAYRRPCQPGGLQSGTGSVWHPPPGGAVQRQGRGGRRGTIGGYRRNSFRAFAR